MEDAFKRAVQFVVQNVGAEEGCAAILVVAALVFAIVWWLSWVFLPFSVWSISSKIGDLGDRMGGVREAVRDCEGKVERLIERADRLVERVERLGQDTPQSRH